MEEREDDKLSVKKRKGTIRQPHSNHSAATAGLQSAVRFLTLRSAYSCSYNLLQVEPKRPAIDPNGRKYRDSTCHPRLESTVNYVMWQIMSKILSPHQFLFASLDPRWLCVLSVERSIAFSLWPYTCRALPYTKLDEPGSYRQRCMIVSFASVGW